MTHVHWLVLVITEYPSSLVTRFMGQCSKFNVFLGGFKELVSGCLLSPSEEFELSDKSLGAHIETRGRLILRSELTVNSQDAFTL